ncbi:hypothetical protein [Cellvibrio sp. OA-2007]|uniref:hypothetical protein n=1 Tax=Cellvibrio sp. OA-2007 TaxID=529823 RepID=UPI000781F0F3|nr:hypothetical protein [Cellvibrio sp. OA-2007]
MLVKIQIALCALCWLLVAVPAMLWADDSEQAPIGLLPDIKHDYLLFLANRVPEEITFFGGPHARRDVAELILLQQALALGGFKRQINFINEENYFRSIRNVVEGKTLSISGTIWLQDLDQVKDQVFISPATVRDGEFIVGLYTSPNNQRALGSHTLAELTQLRAVSSRQWKPDLRALQTLGFHQIMYTPNWINMARMLNVGRVDLTLAPFGMSPDLHIRVDGIELVPIPEVKVIIAGSRHWPISQKHPYGVEFYQALTKGMALLRAQGTIEQAYRESGFFHPAVADWTLLNAGTHQQKTGD